VVSAAGCREQMRLSTRLVAIQAVLSLARPMTESAAKQIQAPGRKLLPLNLTLLPFNFSLARFRLTQWRQL
jgi:hypothetical protein